MSDTPNAGIPYVPENALDPAAGLNDALDVIDALLQTAVIDMVHTAPPGSPIDGDLYIVAASPTGDWAGHAGDLARYRSEGDFWQFFTAGVQVKLVLNFDDGFLYRYTVESSPATWVQVAGNSAAEVVAVSATNLDANADNFGQYSRFSHASATYTFDDAAGFATGAEYHGRYVGSGSLTITEAGGMTINAPAGGTLVIPPDGTFTVKIVDTDEADLIGVTVAAT